MLCLNCPNDFIQKHDDQKYCSLTCANQHIGYQRTLRIKLRYEENPKLCKRQDCGKAIPYEKRHLIEFCDSSCAAIENNRLFPKRVSQYELRPCEQCGKSFRPKGENERGRFCQHKCATDYQVNVVIREKILRGEVVKNSSLKRFLIAEHGEICVDCGQGSEWNGKYLCLQVDHKDGNPDNNFPENIRLLCPNCHTQTPTYSKGARDSSRNVARLRNRQRKKDLERSERIELS